MYVGISDKIAHLQISALLVRISKNLVKIVQIWYLAEKLRHWETTSDHPTGLYRGWIWGHMIHPNILDLANNCSFFGKNFKKQFSKKNFIKQNGGVTHVASGSASVEACRVVGGCLSMSQFFGKTSYLNIFSLIFGNS